MAVRPLSDRETLPYLIVFVALSAAICSIPYSTFNIWDGLGAASSVLLAVFGTIYIYRQNGGTSGQHFLQRYFAIGWVVTLRWLSGFVVAAIVLLFTLEAIGVSVGSTAWYDFLFLITAEIIVYWRIGHHIRDVAHRTNAA